MRNKAKIVRCSKNAVDFRIFYGGARCIHIIARKKYFGMAINIHFDIGVHSEVSYTKDTLTILSKVYLILKRKRYGRCFLLPREETTYQKFLRFDKRKWNLI